MSCFYLDFPFSSRHTFLWRNVTVTRKGTAFLEKGPKPKLSWWRCYVLSHDTLPIDVLVLWRKWTIYFNVILKFKNQDTNSTVLLKSIFCKYTLCQGGYSSRWIIFNEPILHNHFLKMFCRFLLIYNVFSDFSKTQTKMIYSKIIALVG